MLITIIISLVIGFTGFKAGSSSKHEENIIKPEMTCTVNDDLKSACGG